MKGRGTRVLTPTDLQAVSGADADAKTHFVIVDAVGVCESDKTDSRPLDRQPTAKLPQLLLGVALGKRDEDTLTTLAARLARLDRAVTPEQRRELSAVTGGPTLSELSAALLRAVDQDVIEATAKALARPTGAPADSWLPEPTSEQVGAARKALVGQACAPFENPAVRDALSDVKREIEQTIDEVTLDTVVGQGFDAAAKEKATSLLRSFRDYIESNKAEITALQILFSRPYRQRLTEPMLKELEKKLRDNHAAWTEDRLWEAFKTATPEQVKGRSQVGRFADLVALVGFALEQQPVLEPFAESVRRRFDVWIAQKATAGEMYSHDQLTWLELIRDHIATSLSIEPDDFGYAPFNQRGGLGKAHQLFGTQLSGLLDELNEVLAA
jgi:type I restriction enzyme R subunit